ncbi:hypothetical protein VTI74DRAFT_11346 [Chaetomium olivicolor]
MVRIYVKNHQSQQRTLVKAVAPPFLSEPVATSDVGAPEKARPERALQPKPAHHLRLLPNASTVEHRTGENTS